MATGGLAAFLTFQFLLVSISAGPVSTEPTPQLGMRWLDPDGQRLPFESDDEVLRFLATAEIVKTKPISEGIGNSLKVLLEKDGLRMHAVFRSIRVHTRKLRLADGAQSELRDDYIFECAAYRLSRLLGLDAVPPTVERSVHDKKGSLQAWVEKARMERKIQEQRIEFPKQSIRRLQVQSLRLFDSLINNPDRHLANMLWDTEGRLWLIDHTRAFQDGHRIRAGRLIRGCAKDVWEKLRALDEIKLKDNLGPYLPLDQIQAVVKRRELLLELVGGLISSQGEDRVLFEASSFRLSTLQ